MADINSGHLYALALGSNRPLSGRRTPARLLEEGAAMIGALGNIQAVAPMIATRPVGPSSRMFVNSALLVESGLPPFEMLERLQGIERKLGRRRFLRWGARRMDIDIILWSGGRIDSRHLQIPHPAFRNRVFVLRPLLAIAPGWRDPHSTLSVRHLFARIRKATPLMRSRG